MNKKEYKKRLLWFGIAIGSLVIGLVLGYMLAMWGVFEIMNHIHIQNMVIDLNESELVKLTMQYMNNSIM